MVLSYGKGRIFHTTLGHDVNALSSVGFVDDAAARHGMGGNGRRHAEGARDFPDG